MVGLIEHQQGIQQSSVLDKVQQVKQENLTVYQEYSEADMKDKDVKKQRQVAQSEKSNAAKVRERKKRERKGNQDRRQNQQQQESDSGDEKLPQHRLNIVA